MKLDLAVADKDYYTAPTEPALRTFGTYGYATVAGTGEPMGAEYSAAVALLYRAVYGAKKSAKAEGWDFVVPKLEGLWWVDSDEPALTVPRERWRWKMMIRLPEGVSAAMVTGVRFEEICEGDVVQVLHVGPYAAEPETLGRMAAFMADRGLTMNGRHHEIYLSDPHRAKAETMKTILRHPVRPISG